MVFLLIVHGLIAVALLGSITHQSIALLRHKPARPDTFVERYSSVNERAFTTAIIVMYISVVALGALIYPAYRVDVRIPFEEMSLGWAVGVFELKEHFAGIGLGVLPFYANAWRQSGEASSRLQRLGPTLIILFVVWWNFLVGHVLNNIRGLG